jgi:hypothetical protein
MHAFRNVQNLLKEVQEVAISGRWRQKFVKAIKRARGIRLTEIDSVSKIMKHALGPNLTNKFGEKVFKCQACGVNHPNPFLVELFCSPCEHENDINKDHVLPLFQACSTMLTKEILRLYKEDQCIAEIGDLKKNKHKIVIPPAGYLGSFVIGGTQCLDRVRQTVWANTFLYRMIYNIEDSYSRMKPRERLSLHTDPTLFHCNSTEKIKKHLREFKLVGLAMAQAHHANVAMNSIPFRSHAGDENDIWERIDEWLNACVDNKIAKDIAGTATRLFDEWKSSIVHIWNNFAGKSAMPIQRFDFSERQNTNEYKAWMKLNLIAWRSEFLLGFGHGNKLSWSDYLLTQFETFEVVENTNTVWNNVLCYEQEYACKSHSLMKNLLLKPKKRVGAETKDALCDTVVEMDEEVVEIEDESHWNTTCSASASASTSALAQAPEFTSNTEKHASDDDHCTGSKRGTATDTSSTKKRRRAMVLDDSDDEKEHGGVAKNDSVCPDGEIDSDATVTVDTCAVSAQQHSVLQFSSSSAHAVPTQQKLPSAAAPASSTATDSVPQAEADAFANSANVSSSCVSMESEEHMYSGDEEQNYYDDDKVDRCFARIAKRLCDPKMFFEKKTETPTPPNDDVLRLVNRLEDLHKPMKTRFQNQLFIIERNRRIHKHVINKSSNGSNGSNGSNAATRNVDVLFQLILIDELEKLYAMIRSGAVPTSSLTNLKRVMEKVKREKKNILRSTLLQRMDPNDCIMTLVMKETQAAINGNANPADVTA